MLCEDGQHLTRRLCVLKLVRVPPAPNAFIESAGPDRQASPEAMERLIHIMRHSRDERAALLASEKILERAWGKPKAEDDTSNSIMKNMTPDEQKRYVAELLEFAASIEVPIEEDDGSRTAIDSSRAGRRPWARLTAPDQTRVR